MLRPHIAEAILDIAYPRRRLHFGDVADALRVVIKDPIEAERKVGEMYGILFKKLEALYDIRGGR